MNRILLLLFIGLTSLNKVEAQGKVFVKNVQEAQGTGSGMYYALPMTEFQIDVYSTRVEKEAGPYWKYSGKYLGETNVIKEDEVVYQLNKVIIRPKGIPDPAHYYQVTFTGTPAAAFLSLTPEGLIRGINISEETNAEIDVSNNYVDEFVLPPLSEKTEAMVKAGATFKEAEEAANQIFRLRDGRTSLITGENDASVNGNDVKVMLEEINKQESQLVKLFTGTSVLTPIIQTVKYIPKKDETNQIAFRFSKYRGVVDSDDLSGTPAYLKIDARPSVPLPSFMLTPEEEKKRSKMRPEDLRMGFYYRRPSRVDASLIFNGQTLTKIQCDIAQYGEVLNLPSELGERPDSKILFFKETGAIKEISKTK